MVSSKGVCAVVWEGFVAINKCKFKVNLQFRSIQGSVLLRRKFYAMLFFQAF